ncbi:MAG: hypothetical protein JNL98_10455 [Bryobacterales bacterium]|nr:hypothetical protein [Bryobacterales bacterium]
MHRIWGLIVILSGISAHAVTVKSRPCSGGVEAARLQVDIVRPAGGEPRSLSRIKLLDKGSKVMYKPVGLPAELRNNAKVALIVGPAEGEKDVPSTMNILDFKPAASTAEWTVPFRVGLAVFVMGPQGLDEKRVTNLVMRDEELIGALADYAEQTREIEDTVEALTALEEEDDVEYAEAALRLDRGNPTEQALFTLLRALNPTLLANNPLGGGKRMGPVTMANKATVGFFENAGALFPGGGALNEIKPLLFPDTDFRAAFVQHVGSSLAFCVPRLQGRTRNRQVYVWASRIINQGAPSLALASDRRVAIGSRASVPVRAKAVDWRFIDRVDRWMLRPVNGGEGLPVKVRPAAQGRSLELDLRGFPGGSGKYKLMGTWDWDQVTAAGDLELLPLGDLTLARVKPDSAELIAGRGMTRISVEGTDFEFVERVSMLPRGGQLDLAQPQQFFLSQGKRGGVQRQLDIDVDTSSMHSGSYVLALMQTDGRVQELPVTVQNSALQIDNLPLRIGNGTQRITLKGAGLDRLRAVEIAGAEVQLEPANAQGLERVIVVRLRNARRGDKFDLAIQVEGSEQKRRLPGAVEALGPLPRIVSAKTALSELPVAARSGELPAGSFSSVTMQVEASDVASLTLSCNDGEAKLRVGVREAWGSATLLSKDTIFVTLDPGTRWPSGCAMNASIENADGLTSEPVALGRVVRLPRIESISFTGERLSDGSYAAVLTGQDLELIERAGWDGKPGAPVSSMPGSVAGPVFKQTLRVGMPWPSPAPRSPVYVWLRGEQEGRESSVRY